MLTSLSAVKKKISGRPGVRFSFTFVFVCLVLYLSLETAPPAFFHFVNRANTLGTGFLLKLAGIVPRITNDMISYEGFTVKVVGECSAVFISILPLAFFIAYPSRALWKIAGVFAGLPLLFIFNLFRIVLVFMVGLASPKLFPWVHLYFGQVGMIFLVVWICMVWLKYAKKDIRQLPDTRMMLAAFVVSILPFTAWIWLCKPYTWMLLWTARLILELAGFSAVLPGALALYPHTFISFNIVVILSLVMADRMFRKQMSKKKFLTGMGSLMVLHLFFQMLPILFFQNRLMQSQPLINALLVIHQFFLPFIFWVALVPISGKARKANT
ncbi:MAG: archaeosortase/exosortase family protein [Desulfobacterales bacterium]|nr:archaeosortase/exosortase family protein [Desulfobacterales bacterium]